MTPVLLPKVLRWRDWSGTGLEHLEIDRQGDQIKARSAIISDAKAGFAASYSLLMDSDWRVLEVQAAVLGSGDPIHLRRSEAGIWFDGIAERPLGDLDDALEVDLSATPFTNTLPIRRLRLAIGESADIVTAYVAFPQLTITADPQRYTRLARDRYKYQSLTSDFVREITVDQDGFVIAYLGLFQML